VERSERIEFIASLKVKITHDRLMSPGYFKHGPSSTEKMLEKKEKKRPQIIYMFT